MFLFFAGIAFTRNSRKNVNLPIVKSFSAASKESNSTANRNRKNNFVKCWYNIFLLNNQKLLHLCILIENGFESIFSYFKLGIPNNSEICRFVCKVLWILPGTSRILLSKECGLSIRKVFYNCLVRVDWKNVFRSESHCFNIN